MRPEGILTRREVFIFFLVLSLLYAFPIIHADYAYVDDCRRALLMADDGWRIQGRILLEVMSKVLAFSGATVNIFPFPLLLSLLAIAWAMTNLTLRYFAEPTIPSCFVVLPVLCSPFFLGNLTYQYDGPSMVLGVVASIFAITCKVRSYSLQIFLSGALITIALSFYQLTVSLFIGLCCVELVWGVRNRISLGDVLNGCLQRLLQLVVGGILYFLPPISWLWGLEDSSGKRRVACSVGHGRSLYWRWRTLIC